MTISARHAAASATLCIALVVVPATGGYAQTRDRPATPAANSDLTALANGWTALAAGKIDDAVTAADLVLGRAPLDHRAVDLKIDALAGTQPLRALDAYDVWCIRTKIDDIFLLAPIARGTLEQIAAGDDRGLKLQALQRLAQAGDPSAAARIKQVSAGDDAAVPGSTAGDIQLAMSGDEAAAKRLMQPAAIQSLPPQTVAKVLPAAGPMAIPTLRSLLKHPAPPVRMEAAIGLGKLNATEAIADLKPMLNDPEVRSFVAVALTRLGDRDAEAIVQEMLQSPIFDMRVLGAQAYEGKGAGPWVQALMPALKDPNGLTRIRAAELLAPVAPEAALPVLLDASKDPNPVVRADVSRVFQSTGLLATAAAEPIDTSTGGIKGPVGLAELRRMLRDPDAAIRLNAAATLLVLARGGSR
jgi:hypothetical protein